MTKVISLPPLRHDATYLIYLGSYVIIDKGYVITVSLEEIVNDMIVLGALKSIDILIHEFEERLGINNPVNSLRLHLN